MCTLHLLQVRLGILHPSVEAVAAELQVLHLHKQQNSDSAYHLPRGSLENMQNIMEVNRRTAQVLISEEH